MNDPDGFMPTSPPPSGGGSSPRQWPQPVVRLAGYGLGVLLAVGLGALALWLVTVVKGNLQAAAGPSQPVGVQQPVPPQWQRPIVSDLGLIDNTGIRLTQVAISGGGGLIDLRFQVINPDKAASLHDGNTPPMLIDEASGLVVSNLLMGHSHEQGFQAGVTYYLIFENPGNLVQRGGTVSVLLGPAEVDHVAVR